MTKNSIALGCALALVGASVNANAAAVIAVNPDTANSTGGGLSLACLYGADPYTSILAVGWTSSLSFSAVTVTTQMASSNPVGATGHAYLTTRLGTGTTVADQVAATSFVFPANANGNYSGLVTLFSGLNLTAGTPYFLTIVPDAGFTAGWYYTGISTISSDDPGLTVQPGHYQFDHDPPYTDPRPGPAAYIPASDFIYPNGGGAAPIYAVTGTIVPEPSAVALLGIGLGLTLISRRSSNFRGRH